MEKGHVIRVSPDTGEEIGEKSKLTLTVSRGTWFVVKDYRHRLPEEVEKELNEQNPNIKLEISYEQRANTWPGYIAEQSGLEIGEKLDPDKEYTLKITVSQLMSWKIEGVVGKTAEEAIALIKEKTGILPVSDERSYDDLSEEEQKTIKKGVVTDVDPAEGTEYVQQMENPNVITIRFYKLQKQEELSRSYPAAMRCWQPIRSGCCVLPWESCVRRTLRLSAIWWNLNALRIKTVFRKFCPVKMPSSAHPSPTWIRRSSSCPARIRIFQQP